MHLQAVHGGARRLELQHPFVHPVLQIDANRAHVAHDLALRLFEGEVDAALTRATGSIDEGGGETRLPRAGPAGEENAAPPEVPLPAQHRVELLDTAGDPI